MWCSTTGLSSHTDHVTPFVIDGSSVAPVNLAQLLGVHLDSELRMTNHISRTVSTCFYQLRRLKGIRKSLPLESAKTLVSSFVTSRLDYCNGVLAGSTQKQTASMQSILNAAPRLLCGGTKRDHITPLIRDKLHWLRFTQRVTYKLCTLVYKSIHNSAPQYLTELLHPVASSQCDRRLRSSSSLDVVRPRCRLKFGERGFSVAAPEAWNSLPSHVKSASTLTSFKDRLKTELFSRSYP